MNSNTHSVRPPEPLTQTGQALTDGELSPAHAAVLAHGTQELAAPLTAEAEAVLVEADRPGQPGLAVPGPPPGGP
jgi:hypothetical protein